MTSVTEFFKDLTLPTLPPVAQALIRSLNEDDVPLRELQEVIECDPALAVQLLRLANSARYRGAQPVGHIDDAIARVGTGQVRALALASFLNDAFPVAPGLDRTTFWRDSQSYGGMAQWLASGIGSDSQEAWLCGVMVRLGELLMGLKVPSCVREFERQPQYPGARWEREAAIMGFTEGEVSAELARSWNFPPTMVQALEAAADPLGAQPFSRLGGVLHVAEMVSEGSAPAEHLVEKLPPAVLDALDVDPDWLRERLPQAHSFVASSTLH